MKTNSLLEQIREYKKEYLKKSVELIKANRDKVFSIAPQESYHYCDPFEGDSGTTYFEGYVRIAGEQSDGNPLVRIVHADIIVHMNHFYPDQKALNNCKRYIKFNTWTGYSWDSLVDLVGDVVDEDKILPFFKDILYSDDKVVGYMMKEEDIRNNIKPWERREEAV